MRIVVLLLASALLLVGCLHERVATQRDVTLPTLTQPAEGGEDLVFVMQDSYREGGTAKIKIKNTGSRAYIYSTYYSACTNLHFLKENGMAFKIPEGTHCDLANTDQILPGQEIILLEWSIDECTEDHWGCVKSALLPSGRYAIKGEFVAVGGERNVASDVSKPEKSFLVTESPPLKCEKIDDPDLKSNCFAEIGIISWEPSACERIQNKNTRDYCYNIAAAREKKPSICTRIKDESRIKECYFGVGEASGDVDTCEEIPDATNRDDCYFGHAVGTKDGSICGKILEAAKSYSCRYIANPKSFRASECEKTILENRDSCYLSLALEYLDPMICEKLTEASARDRCYSDVAGGKNDPDTCKKISTEITRDNCYSSIGMSKGDLSICDKITGYKYYCYQGVAVKKKDATICEKIPSQEDRDICKLNVANAG